MTVTPLDVVYLAAVVAALAFGGLAQVLIGTLLAVVLVVRVWARSRPRSWSAPRPGRRTVAG